MSTCRSVGIPCYIQHNGVFRGFMIFNLNISDFQFYRCSKSFVDQPTVSSVFVESFSDKHLPQVFFTKINQITQIISLIIRIHARGLTCNVVWFFYFLCCFQRFEPKTGVHKLFLCNSSALQKVLKSVLWAFYFQITVCLPALKTETDAEKRRARKAEIGLHKRFPWSSARQ